MYIPALKSISSFVICLSISWPSCFKWATSIFELCSEQCVEKLLTWSQGTCCWLSIIIVIKHLCWHWVIPFKNIIYTSALTFKASIVVFNFALFLYSSQVSLAPGYYKISRLYFDLQIQLDPWAYMLCINTNYPYFYFLLVISCLNIKLVFLFLQFFTS